MGSSVKSLSSQNDIILSQPVISPILQNVVRKTSQERRKCRRHAAFERDRSSARSTPHRDSAHRSARKLNATLSSSQLQQTKDRMADSWSNYHIATVGMHCSPCPINIPSPRRRALAEISTNTIHRLKSDNQPSAHSTRSLRISPATKKVLECKRGIIAEKYDEDTPRRLLWPAGCPKDRLRREGGPFTPPIDIDRDQHLQVLSTSKIITPPKPEKVYRQPKPAQRYHPYASIRVQGTGQIMPSYAALKYRPRTEVAQRTFNTESSTRNKKHDNSGAKTEKQRSSLAEMIMRKLPTEPPTLHAQSSQGPANPGSPYVLSPAESSFAFGSKLIPPSRNPAVEDAQLGAQISEITARRMLRWEIWLYRVVFGTVLMALNISLLLVYLLTPRHQYLLIFLVFMKSKDLLSTVAGVLGLLVQTLYNLIWPPETVNSKWIMSIVCAYAETEEQIMKTINSLTKQDLVQHKQVLCVILDGKPRDVLSHFTRVTHMMKRSYSTWKSAKGELQIHAGFINETPIILIQKGKNAGKKDTLILGHSLFNYPRDDAPVELNVLRRDIFTHMLPSLTGQENFKTFDYVYATDADSIIHKDCLRELANALARKPQAIAACGIIIAELSPSEEWSVWHLFQQFQYSFGQYVRRQAESIWGRVTCLPGPVTMIAIRPEMGKAISEYAAPIPTANLFLHQVQYQGTDRRLTYCMLAQGRHLKTILVTSAVGETVVPSSLDHYLSQRRRWAANAYFNDYMYTFGKNQHPITRLFGLIDIIRMSFVYYRVMNTALFIRSLVRKFYLVKILPTLILTKSPTTWFILLVLLKQPVLRKRLHKLLCGVALNQIMSPVLSIIVFSKVLLNMGNHAWGKTGVSSKDAKAFSMAYATSSSPKAPWSPARLVSIIRNAIRPPLIHDNASEKVSETSTSTSSSEPSTRPPTIISKTSSISGGSTKEDEKSTKSTAIKTPSVATSASIRLSKESLVGSSTSAAGQAPSLAASTSIKSSRESLIAVASSTAVRTPSLTPSASTRISRESFSTADENIDPGSSVRRRNTRSSDHAPP